MTCKENVVSLRKSNHYFNVNIKIAFKSGSLRIKVRKTVNGKEIVVVHLKTNWEKFND